MYFTSNNRHHIISLCRTKFEIYTSPSGLLSCLTLFTIRLIACVKASNWAKRSNYYPSIAFKAQNSICLIITVPGLSELYILLLSFIQHSISDRSSLPAPPTLITWYGITVVSVSFCLVLFLFIQQLFIYCSQTDCCHVVAPSSLRTISSPPVTASTVWAHWTWWSGLAITTRTTLNAQKRWDLFSCSLVFVMQYLSSHAHKISSFGLYNKYLFDIK